MAGLDIENMRYATSAPAKFSKIELRDIAISIAVLSLAFVIMFRNSTFMTTFFRYYLGDLWVLGMFGMMAVIVIFSFLLHEFGHKFTAQRMGMWSEYRMFPNGLLITIVMSFFGFLFAAPGVVYIRGYVTEEQDGKISIAGPMVNIVLAIAGLGLACAFDGNPMVVFFYLMFTLNASLALFNLLPIAILDGAKIMRWNAVYWGIAFAIAAILFASRWFGILPDFYYTLG